MNSLCKDCKYSKYSRQVLRRTYPIKVLRNKCNATRLSRHLYITGFNLTGDGAFTELHTFRYFEEEFLNFKMRCKTENLELLMPLHYAIRQTRGRFSVLTLSLQPLNLFPTNQLFCATSIRIAKDMMYITIDIITPYLCFPKRIIAINCIVSVVDLRVDQLRVQSVIVVLIIVCVSSA